MKSGHQQKILLGQLNSNGDCLYATTVAKQIKTDFPECHLTWAIGSYCAKIISNNPFVDEVWEIPLANVKNTRKVWDNFKQEAHQRQQSGEFDQIFLVQLVNENYAKFDGTIRTSIFRSYPFPITVSPDPVLFLTNEEVANVNSYVMANKIDTYKNVILFECAPLSNQAPINPQIAKELCEEIIKINPDTCFILSSNIKIDSESAQIIDGSILTLRETAELTKYCTLLVGCSSGITWISTSSWAKKLPMIQLLNPKAIFFNSVVNDHKRIGLSTEKIVELSNYDRGKVKNAILEFLTNGIESVKRRFHEDMPIGIHSYQHLFHYFLKNYQFSYAIELIRNSCRYVNSMFFGFIYIRPAFDFLIVTLPRKIVRNLLGYDKINPDEA